VKNYGKFKDIDRSSGRKYFTASCADSPACLDSEALYQNLLKQNIFIIDSISTRETRMHACMSAT
jgi:hypothetical protein